MNRLRKLTLVCGTVGIALGAGHLVQQRDADVSAAAAVTPTAVETVSAGPVAAETSPVTASPPPAVTLAALPEPAVAAPVAEPVALEAPAVTAEPAPAPVAAVDCTPQMQLIPLPGASLSLWLKAPCAADTRVVLLHEGLEVAYQLLPSGNLFVTLPALAERSVVSARMDDGFVVAATAQVPDLQGMRRLSVQWQGDAAFALTGPTAPVLLGDPTLADTQLALVTTLPAGAAMPGFEAEVTTATCNRTLAADVIVQAGPVVRTSAMTLAMPDCDGTGDILVLNNLLPDVTLAQR